MINDRGDETSLAELVEVLELGDLGQREGELVRALQLVHCPAICQ